MATKAPVKKTRVTKKHVAEHREAQRTRASRDTSPNWEGSESWTLDQFQKHFYVTTAYYRLEADSKSYKPIVLRWLTSVDASKSDIAAVKKLKDNRFNSTMAAIAGSLMRGMPAVRKDWNGGKDSAAWLREAIVKAMNEGQGDVDPDEEKTAKAAEAAKTAALQPSIQERVREAAWRMTEELEDAIESFQVDPNAFDPKAFKVANLLRGKGVKAAHARIIKDFYQKDHDEKVEALTTKDEQLKEGYSHLSKVNLKKIILFYSEILSACDMLMQEAKVNRAPRAKKPTDKTKVVAKLKFLKQDEVTKSVSINPIDIIGASELWVYNTKTRKLGKYVAAEFAELGVKGTSITGFDEAKSVQKTLRKPAEQLKEFKAAGKVALRKFLDEIKAVDIKLNGRVNEDVLLLKVQ